MRKLWHIAYIGLEPSTLDVLCASPDLRVVAVAHIDSFALNPANALFRLLYTLRRRGDLPFLERLLLPLWRLLHPCATQVFSRYAGFLTLLVQHRIRVVDFDNDDERPREPPDLIVVNAWGLLPRKILAMPRHGVLNIHPAKLPKYRGAVPTLWALRNGDAESAVTYMLLDAGMDTGPILAQHPFPIDAGDDALALERKIERIDRQMLVADALAYLRGMRTPVPQDHAGATYTPRYLDYLRIDPDAETARDIRNKVRLYPWVEPHRYAFVRYRGRDIRLKDARPVRARLPGTGVRHALHRLLIGTRDGVLGARLLVDIGFADSLYIASTSVRTLIGRASAALLLAVALPAFAGDEPESRLYAELAASAYAGSGRFTQEAYLDFALGDSVSLWANPYHETGYSSATAGIAKTVGDWTFALGAGQNRYDGERAAILAPWLAYNSDAAELVLSVERYDNGDPAFWQGYVQHRVRRHFLGVYGETDFGIGPAVTFAFNDHLRLRVAVPVAERGDAWAMATMIVVP